MSGSVFQAATEISVGERDGRLTVTFLRTGDLSKPVDVIYDITTESATQGIDFTGASGTVRFQAGADQAKITIDILNDALFEQTETFIVSLVSVGPGGSLSVPRTLRVNILDDENPVLPPATPPLVSEYRVTMERIVENLDQPINMEFSASNPDLAYVAQKGGLIRVVNVKTGEDLGVFLDLTRQVNEAEDHGLIDIALHPDFSNNPYVYAFYVADPPEAGTSGYPGLDQNLNRYSHVVRYTADASQGFLRAIPNSGVVLVGNTGQSMADISGGGRLNYSSPTYASEVSSERFINPANPAPVIDGFKQNYLRVDSLSHSGGALAFGPDGMLYVSTGDGASPNYADPRTPHVQNLNSLAGKILRIDPLTGRGLADNPFYQPGTSLDANVAKVFQYGLRNPFSMGFDSQGKLFISDTGWNNYEEINFGPSGANFGWPWYEGGTGGTLIKTSGYSGFQQAQSFYQGVANGTIAVLPPFAAFGHAASAPGFSNQAITGGNVIYSGDRYPADLKGDYFFGDFNFARVYSIDTANRQDVKFLLQTDGIFAPVHFTQGPDGYVYFVELGGRGGFENDGVVGRMLIGRANEPAVSVTPTVTVSEGPNRTADVTFALSAIQNQDVTVTYSTTGGSAKAGTDFMAAREATLVIPAGQASATARIQVVDDSIFESSEAFAVELVRAALNGQPISAGGVARVTVTDNDAPPQGINLLVNGSLEQSALAAGQFKTFTSIPGWTAIPGGTIELWRALNGVNASDGLNFAELDYTSGFDGFQQVVQTSAGQTYALTFDARLRPSTSASTQAVEVLWNGQRAGLITPDSTWKPYSLAVTGSGSQGTLTIRELTGQSGDGRGALLDNFRLVAQPSSSASLTSSGEEGPTLANTVDFWMI
jgi:glucose/arabinose dehydrogenase